MRNLVAMGLIMAGGLACGADPLPQGGVPANWEDVAQVSLEVRFLLGPGRFFASLRKTQTLHTPTTQQKIALAEVADKDLAEGDGLRVVSASRLVETQTPVFAERLDDEAVRSLIGAVQADPQGSIMLAPKVTVFDRQTTEVADVTLRPFAVGLGRHGDADTPQIRSIEQGTKLLLRCEVRPGNTVRVDFRARLSSINDLGLLEVGQSGAMLQVPHVDVEDIQLAAVLRDGQTLAVHSVISRKREPVQQTVPLLTKVPYVSKLFKNPPPTEREEFVILLTPRIVVEAQEKPQPGGE